LDDCWRGIRLVERSLLASPTIDFAKIPSFQTQTLQKFQMEFAAEHRTQLFGSFAPKESKIPPVPEEIKKQSEAIVGFLKYVEARTRPDLSFAASQLAWYMTNPTMEHLNDTKHALRHLASTRHLKLVLGGHNNCEDKKAYPAVISVSRRI
jgi:hypothetical protein